MKYIKYFSIKKRKKIEQKPEPEPELEPELEPEIEPEPELKPELKPEPKPEPELKPELKPEPKPEPKPIQKLKKNSKTRKNRRFVYEFSSKGIRYDGKYCSPDNLLNTYEKNGEAIDELIYEVLGNKENVNDFINNSDRLIYLSILSSNAKINKTTNKLVIGETEMLRLREYYRIWNNPNSKEKSNMSIIYDFKNRAAFSRLFQTLEYDYKDELKNIEDNAIALRKRKNVSIKNIGLVPVMKYTMQDINEKIRKLLQDWQKHKNKKYNNKNESSKNNETKSFRKKIKEMTKGKTENKKKNTGKFEKPRVTSKHSRDEDYYERF